nr:MAG TPA: hypothetical protein [Caudoviricetes sp.]
MIEVYWLLHWDNEQQMFIAYPKSNYLGELSDKSLFTLLDKIKDVTMVRVEPFNHYGKEICIYYYIDEEFLDRIHILEGMTKFKFKVLAKFVVVWLFALGITMGLIGYILVMLGLITFNL